VLLIGSVKPASASEPLYFGEINPEAKCRSAGQNPICALKSWLACKVTDSPVACGAVGHRPFDFINPEDGVISSDQDYLDALMSRPWALPLSAILWSDPGFWLGPGFRLVGYREVGPERFESPVTPIPNELIGTHEVMYAKAFDEESYDEVALSIFLRRQEENWVVVSYGHWTNWEIFTGPCRDEEGTDGRRYCELDVAVPPWPREFDRLARRIEPEFSYATRN